MSQFFYYDHASNDYRQKNYSSAYYNAQIAQALEEIYFDLAKTKPKFNPIPFLDADRLLSDINVALALNHIIILEVD